MDDESLFKFYKIQVESLNDDDTFNSSGNVYQLIWLKRDNYDELYERYKMALHLCKGGVSNVLMPVRNVDNDIRTWYENKLFVLLMKTNCDEEESAGKSLANVHMKGRNFSEVTDEINRYGTWIEMWERRLEQIENLWQEKCLSRTQNDFEKLFINSFPYNLGLAENALSYLSDSNSEFQNSHGDFATICYGKFEHEKIVSGKNPFDWVYDQPMRDVAEYVRNSFLKNPYTHVNETSKFLKEYFSELPITIKSAKFLVARLLLPLNYFESVENYFTTNSEQVRNEMFEKLERESKLSGLYEKLILDIFDIASIPEMYKAVRIPDWIVKAK